MSTTTKTYMAKAGEVDRKWCLVDISDQVLGRAATTIAEILMGKHRPEYTPNVDTGDFVLVINASKVKINGASKHSHTEFKRFSGYPGGLKTQTLAEVMREHPERVVEQAVKRMLPKTKLGEKMFKKLKVYAGSDHPHQAQQPEVVKL